MRGFLHAGHAQGAGGSAEGLPGKVDQGGGGDQRDAHRRQPGNGQVRRLRSSTTLSAEVVPLCAAFAEVFVVAPPSVGAEGGDGSRRAAAAQRKRGCCYAFKQ